MQAKFNADMMALARRARGFSQTQLASMLQITQGALSKIETGRLVPDDVLIERLATTLDFKPAFFKKPASLRPPPQSFHRKRKKLTTTEWERINAEAEIYRLCTETLLQSVDLVPSKRRPPEIDADQFDGRIPLIADAVRQAWALPRGPIADVTKLLEDAGVVIVPFDFGTELIDAFCQHAIDTTPPMIFLNTRVKAKDRVRYSLSHELAHLVMHRMPIPTQEAEANLFAACFLMPEADIVHSFYGMSLEKLMTLKMYWKTSMQALIMRARDLGRVTDRTFKYYIIEMSKRGWRSGGEPVEIPGNIEIPHLFRRLFAAHTDQLGLGLNDLEEMFGLTTNGIAKVFPTEKPRLRLVT